jgi:hypothetical protein
MEIVKLNEVKLRVGVSILHQHLRIARIDSIHVQHDSLRVRATGRLHAHNTNIASMSRRARKLTILLAMQFHSSRAALDAFNLHCAARASATRQPQRSTHSRATPASQPEQQDNNTTMPALYSKLGKAITDLLDAKKWDNDKKFSVTSKASVSSNHFANATRFCSTLCSGNVRARALPTASPSSYPAVASARTAFTLVITPACCTRAPRDSLRAAHARRACSVVDHGRASSCVTCAPVCSACLCVCKRPYDALVRVHPLITLRD